jgi:DNA-binding NtrC family response regulator
LLLADLEVGEEDVRLTLPQIATAAKSSGTLSLGTLARRTEAFERETIRAELERSNHSMSEAARALGLERSHLYKKCAQLGIDIKSLRRPEE